MLDDKIIVSFPIDSVNLSDLDEWRSVTGQSRDEFILSAIFSYMWKVAHDYEVDN